MDKEVVLSEKVNNSTSNVNSKLPFSMLASAY